ncbi:MAG TPA: hypothetical protein ENF95_00360 [Candidatus Aenigmarchaeota archaeon]|nr:hypothetical protein [Candidatus Aenigmarchaeota archaeon]
MLLYKLLLQNRIERVVEKIYNLDNLPFSGAFSFSALRKMKGIQRKTEDLIQYQGIIIDKDLQGAFKRPSDTENPKEYLEELAYTSKGNAYMCKILGIDKREWVTVMTKRSPLDIFERYLENL